ncbi:MAG TPA: hypothetical protein VGA69_02720 [Nitriliruptorales bacterium]
MRDLLLIVHIVAVALWLGGSVMNGVINAKVGRAQSIEASAKLARAEVDLGTVFYMPMAILTLVSGVGLVLVSDGVYTFADPFVSVGFLSIIVAAVLGPAKFLPLSRRIAEGFENGNVDAAMAAVKQITVWSTINTALILLAIVVMVLKTGA